MVTPKANDLRPNQRRRDEVAKRRLHDPYADTKEDVPAGIDRAGDDGHYAETVVPRALRLDSESNIDGPVPAGQTKRNRLPVTANQRDLVLAHLINASMAGSVAGSDIQAPPPQARGLPMAALSTPESAGSTSYVITAIDKWGRLADATPTRTMHWPPGTKISFASHPAAGFIVIKASGTEHVTSQGHLRLPLHLRHRLALHAGDRLLLAIMPHLGMITAYPISTVDAMVRAHHIAAARTEDTL